MTAAARAITRRSALKGSAAVLATALLPRAAAAALVATPRQTAGPFYPTDLPAEADWDLARMAGAPPAQGTIAYIGGSILDASGNPLAGTRVEIWQCDANGRYRHPRDVSLTRARDAGFQGFGRVVTDAAGAYRFRTIRPVAYPGRTPHIHFAVIAPGAAPFVTQMYVAGEPGNARDGVLNGVADAQARARLIVALAPSAAEPGALEGRFDIVLGGSG